MDTNTELLAALVREINRVANALEIITSAQVPAPNYKRQLAQYKHFDWDSINAHVAQDDKYGATKVEWNGRTFTRRNSNDKKGAAVWFSCVVSGTVAEGNCKWGRLISFKDSSSEPEPLDDKISQAQAAAGREERANLARVGLKVNPLPALKTSPTSEPAMGAPDPASELEKHFGPTNPRQTTPRATTKPDDARKRFYELSSVAISSGQLTNQRVNELVRGANGNGFAQALTEIEKLLKMRH